MPSSPTEDPSSRAPADAERFWVAASDQLAEGGYLRLDIGHAGETISVVVFRYQGKCLAYRNLCVHMPRELDCEQDMIFDPSGRFLRCSMHGIVYEPLTGESVSEICAGQRLTPIGVVEDAAGIWIADRLASPLAFGD